MHSSLLAPLLIKPLKGDVIESIQNANYLNSLFILQTANKISKMLFAQATVNFVKSIVKTHIVGIEIILLSRTPPTTIGAKVDGV